jgi:crotonobetainyl-CoA:carnitine CoA-transferase CaiB-like acyl-CoA transferase
MTDFLQGIKVASFTHYVFGPLGTQLLADLGADVVSVEPLGGAFERNWAGADTRRADGQSVLFLAVDRNKRSVAIDLKTPKGLEVARRIVAASDVLVTNYRPGVLDKLGLGYEALRREQPGLIYAVATGYGPDGPYAEKPGQDLLAQALSGLAAISGTQETGPRPVGVSAVDHHAAALLALGILAALLRKARSGEGCRVDVSLLSSALDLQAETLTCWLNGPRTEPVVPPRFIGGWHYAAPYGIYPTADGHLAISLGSLKALAEALPAPEIAAFEQAESFIRREEIAACIAAVLAGKPTAEWTRQLDRHQIWNAPVQDYAALLEDPQIRHNASFVTLPGATGAAVTLVSHPIRYDGGAPAVRLPPQPLGAQSESVLGELGYPPEEIAALEAAGVIRCNRTGC